MTKDEYLITDPPLKALTVFAMPMILGSFFQQVYNMADSIIVGQFVGSSALAAVGACAALTNVFICIALGAGVGAGVLVSRYFGALRLRENENNHFYFFNKFFTFKRISRCFWILHFSLDDEHTENACGYNERCGAVLTYLFYWFSVFIYV